MNYKEFSDEFKAWYMFCDEDDLDPWQLRELVARYIKYQDALRTPSRYRDEAKIQETEAIVDKYIDELYGLYDSILEWLGDAPQYKIEPNTLYYWIKVDEDTEDEDNIKKEYMVNRLIIPSHKLEIKPVGHSFLGGGEGGVDMVYDGLSSGTERFIYYSKASSWQKFEEDPPGWFWMETSRMKFKNIPVTKELFLGFMEEMKDSDR